jgi:hypothetical protein
LFRKSPQQKSFSIRWPLFPARRALISEGGHQGRYPKGETTMKSSIRTFVLAAFAAAIILATAHSASAQIYSSNASGNHQLGGGGTASVMVLALPYAGTYMIGGQQLFANTGNQSEFVYCWISTTNGGTTSIPFGPESGATAFVDAWVTLPLNGSYTATGPTDLWVVCRNTGGAGAIALGTEGNITAMLW